MPIIRGFINVNTLYFFKFQWCDTYSTHSDHCIANAAILNKIQNGGVSEFGIFYNALMYSDNKKAADMCREAIDKSKLKEVDGQVLYVE